ncbi:MAG TPA: mechanosensitive ion channel domain-containing protein [Pseudomonadales bacterium]|jgi:small conductance mechanosensitive channel
MDFSVWIDKATELGMTYGIRVALALVILLAGRVVVRVLSRIMERALMRRNMDLTISHFLSNLAYGAGLAFVVIAALGQLGIQTASFVAIIGAAGLAVGLALQGSLSNFAAGVLMITLRPCKVGDFIEAAGVMGFVDEISLFTTTIKTGDNKTVIVPNSDLLNANIINYTREPHRRIDMLIGVSYGADTQKTKQVFRDAVAAESRVLKDQKVDVALRELGASSVNYIVRVWVKTEDYWAVHDDLLEAIKNRLDANGIGIPFPQMDVHFHSTSKNNLEV